MLVLLILCTASNSLASFDRCGPVFRFSHPIRRERFSSFLVRLHLLSAKISSIFRAVCSPLSTSLASFHVAPSSRWNVKVSLLLRTVCYCFSTFLLVSPYGFVCSFSQILLFVAVCCCCSNLFVLLDWVPSVCRNVLFAAVSRLFRTACPAFWTGLLLSRRFSCLFRSVCSILTCSSHFPLVCSSL